MTSTMSRPLTDSEQTTLDRYWRAANYLSACQIYLLANPLLTEPLKPDHIKPRLLGHWGTTPGLNFVWTHLNRAISQRDQDMLLVIGPGHGGPAALANTWLEGSYSEVWPGVPQDGAGMGELFRRFSFPGGVPSHVAPETPGSIHEGGELGYSLSHAFGAAFDNPDLVVACVVGDGEAETGPLATSWHGHRFINPARDGAVLPILHLNGWKIANPALLARIPDDELDALLRGYGYQPVYVTGDNPAVMHQEFAAALDGALEEIRAIQDRARSATPPAGAAPDELAADRAAHPEGLDRPGRGGRAAGGRNLAGASGAAGRGPHQPGPPGRCWKSGCTPTARRSCSPPTDSPSRTCSAWSPAASAGSAPPRTPTAGCCCATWSCRISSATTPSRSQQPGSGPSEPTRVLGDLLRDVMRLNAAQRNFRVFGPDETESNRLGALLRGDRQDLAGTPDPRWTMNLAPDGRVMEILSERACQGWLEGYLLSGQARPVLLLRGVHAHRRLDVQPAREVAEGGQAAALAAARRLAELPADLARLAAGPQRLLAPGPGLHRPRGRTRRPR